MSFYDWLISSRTSSKSSHVAHRDPCGSVAPARLCRVAGERGAGARWLAWGPGHRRGAGRGGADVAAHALCARRAASPGSGARDGRCRGRVTTGDGAAGVAAARAVRGGRPGALLPHRRDREALLHRGNPRRDHGHRLGGAGGRGLTCPPDAAAAAAGLREPGGRARGDGPVCSAGNYRTQMWDKHKEVFLPSTPGLGMHVEVKDPEGKVGPPRVALAWCIRPPFGGALWPCGARRTCAVPGEVRAAGDFHPPLCCRWCSRDSMAPRGASPLLPTPLATIRSACTPTLPGWRSSLAADW